jgi:hypothetical protein
MSNEEEIGPDTLEFNLENAPSRAMNFALANYQIFMVSAQYINWKKFQEDAKKTRDPQRRSIYEMNHASFERELNNPRLYVSLISGEA